MNFKCLELIDFNAESCHDCIFCMIGGKMRAFECLKLVMIAENIEEKCAVYLKESVKEYLSNIFKVIYYLMRMKMQ
jgi:hypothetical protein